MPVINVAELEAERQATLKQNKLVESEQTRRAKQKFRIPKVMFSKASRPSRPPDEIVPMDPPIDAETKHSVKMAVRAGALTVLSQPIKKNSKMLLRARLEANDTITSYIDDRVSGGILGMLGSASREINFMLNYGTEYLRAYNGDERQPGIACHTRAPPPPPSPSLTPDMSPEEQMSAAAFAASRK